MTITQVKKQLEKLDTIAFTLPDGSLVPNHFHVTEIGKISKTFIDCGGTLRQEKKVSLQLWNANDYDHRLHPEKLLKIIEMSEDTLNLQNLDIEVEYQGEQTIQKFGLDYKDGTFQLTSLVTDCLAKNKCDIPAKVKVSLSNLQEESCCTPESGCC